MRGINKEEKICAIVVTYNRKELLKECLDTLLLQTRPLDSIILIDNASTDGTPQFLKENGYLDNKKIDYVRLKENTGGAGGFYEGVKKGYEKGFDWLWLMDDDVKADDKCLEKLLLFKNKKITLVPLRVSNGFNIEESAAVKYNLKNPFLELKEIQVLDLYKKKDDLKKNLEIQDFSFEGPLINRKLIKKIGFPKKDFFIFCDDTDYSLKIRRETKEKILLVKDALLYRMVLVNNKKKREMGWKDYYFLRNVSYIQYKYGENLLVKFKPFFILSGIILKSIFRLKIDFKKIKIVFYALLDHRKKKLPRRYLPDDKI